MADSGVGPERWLIRDPARAGAARRLYCFPFAGGGASIYRSWRGAFGSELEVCAVQLPGRESRLAETPVSSFPALVELLSQVLGPALDRPYAFFGHSMGARIAFELARRLRTAGVAGPEQLLVSGCVAPHLVSRARRVHMLPADELLQEIAGMGGTPPQILENKELMELFLPALRADLTVDEVYTFEPDEPLQCPIHAFGGLEDETVNLSELEGWRRHTSSAFELHTLAGGHFFLSEQESELLAKLRAVLRPDELRS